MKKIIAVIILLMVFGVLFAGMARDIGLLNAALTWVCALAGAGLLFVAIKWLAE